MPGKTSPVRGKYNPQTGDYAIEWTSQIVDGPFNNFTGLWRLTGRTTATGSGAAPGRPGHPLHLAPLVLPPRPELRAPWARWGTGHRDRCPPVVNNAITVAQTNRGFWQSTGVSRSCWPWSRLPPALLTNADRLFSRRRSPAVVRSADVFDD